MSIEINVPQLPESVADATLVTWHKKPGDAVSRDENLVDVETDKVVLEVPAPADGVLTEIVEGEGANVVAGQLIAKLEAGAKAAAPAASTQATPSADAPAAAPLSPAVRRVVEQSGIDPAQVAGSGKDGRLTKSDVQNHLSQNTASAADATPVATSSVPAVAASPAVTTPAAPAAGSGERLEQRVPMTRLRKTVAKRLVQAQQTAAMLTTFNEVDLYEVDKLRKRYRDHFEKNHGVRLGYMSFFVKAAVEALKKFPVINASVDGSDIIYHGYFDVGVAVSSPRGLVVPVMRDVDTLSFAEVEQQIRDYGSRAKDGKLGMEELMGGTFTISNGGTFGSMMSTPILNPPQSAILGMHSIKQRPVVVDGEIVIRPMMYLAVSYDHRIIDGKEAVQFLVSIKESLEDPARLLLQI